MIVVAMNSWHADLHFVPVGLMMRAPNKAQVKALKFDHLRALVRAGKVSSLVGWFRPWISPLEDLSEFLTREGHACDPYSRAFPGAPDLQDRELKSSFLTDPSTPSASWDPSPHLSDTLWMTYQGLGDWARRNQKRRQYNRLAHGDFQSCEETSGASMLW